jgi:hypothetical protein
MTRRNARKEAAIDSQRQDGYVYAAFGLRISSPFLLPELQLVPCDGAPADVVIELGSTPGHLPGGVELPPFMQVAHNRFLLDAPAGRYLLEGGRTIMIDPAANATNLDLRLYLLGTVMGALCFQRGVLPLHAAVVDTPRGAVAFAGPSGVGKSTLAAQFLRRGGTVLADDLVAITSDETLAPWVQPGLNRIKLWRDSLALAQVTDADLPRIAEGVEKLSYTTPAVSAPRPLRSVYILRPSDDCCSEILPLTGPEAVGALIDNLYRWPLAVAMGQAPRQFRLSTALASHCSVFEIRFRHDSADAFKLHDMAVAHLDRQA